MHVATSLIHHAHGQLQRELVEEKSSPQLEDIIELYYLIYHIYKYIDVALFF